MNEFKWISVKDQLPEKILKVLIYVPETIKYGQDKFVACLCDWDNCTDWHILSENFTHEIITFKPKEVTHWMILPLSPEDK